MLIELPTVMQSAHELYEREMDTINHEKYNTPLPPPHNKEDIVVNIVIDMDTVIDFTTSTCWFNDSLMDAIFVRTSAEDGIPLLLCKYDVFKKMFEEAKNKKIKNISEWK